jgi:hypothetical protein
MAWIIDQVRDAQAFDGEDDGGGGGGGTPESSAAPPPLYRESSDDAEPSPLGEPPEEETAPESAPAPNDSQLAELQRRDAQLVEAQRQFRAQMEAVKPLRDAAELIKAGKKGEAARLLGLDLRQALIEEYGEDLVPKRPAPKPEEQIAELGKRHETAEQKIARLEEQLALSEIGRDIRDVLDANGEELQLMRFFARKGGSVFLKGMVDRMHKHHAEQGYFPEYSDLLRSAEDEYSKKWIQDNTDVLKIAKIRGMVADALGVDFIERKKGSKTSKQSPPVAPSRKKAVVEEDDEPESSLAGSIGVEPSEGRPRRLTRAQAVAASIEMMRRSRERKETGDKA